MFFKIKSAKTYQRRWIQLTVLYEFEDDVFDNVYLVPIKMLGASH